MVSVLRLSIHCKSKLSSILGKALDVCHPLSGVMNITNACDSTNQEIHGSIPCTFIFLFSLFLNFSGVRDRRNMMRLYYSVTEGYLLLLTST